MILDAARSHRRTAKIEEIELLASSALNAVAALQIKLKELKDMPR